MNNKFKHAAIIPLAGGFSLGAMEATGDPPAAIFSYKKFGQNDKLLTNYLNKLGYEIPYYVLDNLTENQLNEIKLLKGNIDFVHGIPPCSGLSQASLWKKNTRDVAPPNDWMYDSAEFILNNIQPKIYAFENAPGLYTNIGIPVREKLIEIGKKYGYAITFYKTNTLKHGIPQFRPRTFALFYKGSNAPMLNYYNEPRLNLTEYLQTIPKEAKHQDEFINEHWDISKYEITKYLKHLYGDKWREEMTNLRPHITSYDYLFRTEKYDDFVEWRKTLPEEEQDPTVTKNLIHIKKNHDENRNARVSYKVLGVDKEYTYAVIGEMMIREIHPIEDRLMNIREHMHLMGLPHDYELEDKRDYVKITQNVPVCTCVNITQEIIEILLGNRPFYHDSVFMQDNSVDNPKILSSIKYNALF